MSRAADTTDTADAPELDASGRRALRIARRRPRLGTRLHRFALRLSRGRVDPDIALLTTTGRRSGKRRTVPLMHVRDDDRILVVAMNNGFDPQPAWFHNLTTDPHAVITVRGVSTQVGARVVSDAERSELWPGLTRQRPLWAAFQAHTDRQAPVIELKPTRPHDCRR